MATGVFLLRIEYVSEGDCWRFYGAHDKSGYGRISINGKQQQVQRFIWQSLVEELPAGKRVKTSCGTKDCVRLAHLFVAISPGPKREFTHCKRGHLFQEPNIRYQKSGRACKICAGLRQNERNRTKRLNE